MIKATPTISVTFKKDIESIDSRIQTINWKLQAKENRSDRIQNKLMDELQFLLALKDLFGGE